MTHGVRLPMAVLVLAGLLLGLDTLAWLGMQRLLDRRLERLVGDARHAGWQIESAAAHRGGWPIAATLTLSAPRLHGAEGLMPGGITWSGERITAVFSPVHPRRITILAGGTQTVSAGPSGATLAHSLRLWGAETALHVPVVSPGEREVSFDAGALHVALPGAGPDDVLTVAGLDGTLRWNDDGGGEADALAMRIGLHGVGLPIPGGWHVGPEGTGSPHVIGSVSAELSFIGGRESGQSGPGIADFASRVRGWRDGGGRVLLREAVMDWGGAKLRASGDARLDGNFRPDGAFSVRISGANALLASLVQSGRMTLSAASAVRAVLGLIGAAQTGDGGQGQGGDGEESGEMLELPLVLRSGTLMLGQIPLLNVPFPVIGRSGQGADYKPMGALP